MPGATRYQQGNEIFDIVLYLPSVAVPNVAGAATATQTVTVSGVLPGDMLHWNQIGTITGLMVDNVYVSAPNTCIFYWSNATGSAINGSANQAFLLGVTRPENASLGLSALPSAIV
jgi:hypothetical protein